MRSVCLINSYNYETYLEACVRSALCQTRPFDVIHIVDDGSTDKSRPMLEALASQFHNIVLHFKQNGGQLSCFNTATQFVQPDDLICMLDADDVLPADYLALLLQKRQLMPADLYFCEPTYFKNTEPPPASAARATSDPDFAWQISSHTVRKDRIWTGSPTSCISLTGALFLQLLPFPFESDWRTRADDILILGSAIVGASKCYLPSLTIGYRVHGANSFYGKTEDSAAKLRYALRVERVFNTYCARVNLSQIVDLLEGPARREIELVPNQLRSRFNLPTDRTMTLQKYRGARRTLKKLRMMLKGEY
ncbi:glycosyltransferase family 2 protein [Aquabacterium sp.]|uniref:glycosyltransferase family 2 protein n=1 Tax=Aquabacterium sp. TaxID=1872578 RepID=UPI003BB197FC